jgi:hypothetical protein
MNLNKLPPEFDFDFLDVEAAYPSFCTQAPIYQLQFWRKCHMCRLKLARLTILMAEPYLLLQMCKTWSRVAQNLVMAWLTMHMNEILY